MFTELSRWLASAPRRRKAKARRRRADRLASVQARWTAPPTPVSTAYLNELGAWCGVEQGRSRAGHIYVWIPWDCSAQIRRFR